jgi:hypothetical protein
VENVASTGIRSLNLPARRESINLLSYPGSIYYLCCTNFYPFIPSSSRPSSFPPTCTRPTIQSGVTRPCNWYFHHAVALHCHFPSSPIILPYIIRYESNTFFPSSQSAHVTALLCLAVTPFRFPSITNRLFPATLTTTLPSVPRTLTTTLPSVPPLATLATTLPSVPPLATSPPHSPPSHLHSPPHYPPSHHLLQPYCTPRTLPYIDCILGLHVLFWILEP